MDKDWTPDIYGDVPVAYAVYRLLFAKDGRTVRDTEYVFVNEIYCEMAGVKKEDLLGKSFFSVYANGDPIWMTYCTKAYQEGKADAEQEMARQAHAEVSPIRTGLMPRNSAHCRR